MRPSLFFFDTVISVYTVLKMIIRYFPVRSVDVQGNYGGIQHGRGARGPRADRGRPPDHPRGAGVPPAEPVGPVREDGEGRISLLQAGAAAADPPPGASRPGTARLEGGEGRASRRVVRTPDSGPCAGQPGESCHSRCGAVRTSSMAQFCHTDSVGSNAAVVTYRAVTYAPESLAR